MVNGAGTWGGGEGQCGRGIGGGGAVGLCMPLYDAIAFSKPQPTSEKVGSPKPYHWPGAQTPTPG